MFLVGLSLPPFAAESADVATAALQGVSAAQPPLPWGVMAGHVLALTVLANLGIMVPALCYRREAGGQERLALAIRMWPRSEVGAGVLTVSLGYGLGGPMITAAMLSLALNLVLTGAFILLVKPKNTTPHFMQRTFFTGLLILVPLFVTYVLIAFLFNLFTSASAPLMKGLFHLFDLDRYTWVPLIPIINLLLSFAVIFLLGLFGTNILGLRILQAVDALILRLPPVKSVYGAVKQVVDTFQGPRRSFQRVVLIEYPRKGTWTMDLVAAERHNTLNLAPSASLLTVYIPTTPKPTSG